MKVKITGHYVSIDVIPWWYNKIGEIIEISNNPKYYVLFQKQMYHLLNSPIHLIHKDDFVNLREEKLKRILNEK